MIKTIELRCEVCGKLFSRPVKEHTRSVKLGRKEVCNRLCAGRLVQNNLGKFKGKGDASRLQADNRKDQFTGFRYYMRKAEDRTPGSDITVEDIKLQWDKQKGKCAYTGIPLTLKNDKLGNKDKKPYEMASLDRIDSSKPYEKGNIQFLSLSINLMKHAMSDQDTRELIRLIRY